MLKLKRNFLHICFKTVIFLFASLPILLHGQAEIPTGLSVQGYDSHFELSWNPSSDPSLSGFRIYKICPPSSDQAYVGYVDKYTTSYIDFVGRQDLNCQFLISSVDILGVESQLSESATAVTFEMSDEELLTMVQKYTFRYFWDFAHPVSGMARERNTTSIVTSGGSGFGVMAILVGIERGFITYEQGLQRVLKIVNFLETADRFHGAWPHWMNGGTGATIPFSTADDGGDIVETAFLLEGLLTARQYFNEEVELNNKITQLWEEMDWRWYRKQTQQVLYWHWSPTVGWEINFAIRGFNETHIVYLLAIASPTNFVPASLYNNGWAGSNYTNNGTFYGYPLEVGQNNGGPLFFSHYSYIGFDPRAIKDDYANYFNRNLFHTLINRAYCIDNPENHAGYSNVSWGLTASDDPWGYLAHEPTAARDNGTITPTAALSSMPYTPEQSIQALKHFYREKGDRLWGKYGFYDAFNLDQDWFASSYLAIDQGPIICMIENYRSELLWNNFMSNPEITTALDAIGFEPDTDVVNLENVLADDLHLSIFPNPVSSNASLQFVLNESEQLTIDIYSDTGLLVQRLYQNKTLEQGQIQIDFNTKELPKGFYVMVLQTDKWKSVSPFVKQ